MIEAAIPANEAERMAALRRYAILDTPPEAAFDDLVTIAAGLCSMPMGSMTLVDGDRQWFKATVGLTGSEGPRGTSFCAHVVMKPDELLIVRDTHLDTRFHDNPHVSGEPNLRFYAGVPLLSSDGFALGSFCVMDTQPRELEPFQLESLRALSRQASKLLELRRLGIELRHQLDERAWYETQLKQHQAELELQNAELNEQTRTDPLTGLANRRAFSAAAEALRGAYEAFALAIVDVDHFKLVNDLHGHPTGDAVLVEIADALRTCAGGFGLVARLGGEEFVWLMPGRDAREAAVQCEYLRQTIEFASMALPVTVSIGVSALQPGDGVEDVLSRADQALYRAKRAGRNRVEAG